MYICIYIYVYACGNSKAAILFRNFARMDHFFVRTRKEMKIATCRSTRARLRGPIQKIRRAVGIKSSIRTFLRIFCCVLSLPLTLSLCFNNIYPRTRHSPFNGRVFAGNPSFLRTSECRVFCCRCRAFSKRSSKKWSGCAL